MSAASTASRDSGRHAILIDLENLLTLRDEDGQFTGWVSPAEADRRIRLAIEVAGPHQFIWAAGTCWVWQVAVPTLAALNIKGSVSGRGADESDFELLRQADHLSQLGYRKITMVSGDGIFAQIANNPNVRLHVIAPFRRMVAKKLRLAAAETVVLAELDTCKSEPERRASTA